MIQQAKMKEFGLTKWQCWSTVPITVISARSEDKDKIDALDAGADDYITKPFSTAELLARIRGNYRRIQYMQNNLQGGNPVFRNGSLTINYQMQTVYVKEEEVHVTPIEYKILCLLAKNLGRVLTHTHITKEIWGSSLEWDIASLRVHVATVRKKIEKKDNLNKCIKTHVGIGYCMVKQEERTVQWESKSFPVLSFWEPYYGYLTEAVQNFRHFG